jgi:hypothetical protein
LNGDTDTITDFQVTYPICFLLSGQPVDEIVPAGINPADVSAE